MLNLNYINCRQPTKKGQVYFGRFYLGKRKQGRDTHMASRPFSLEKDRLIERDDRSSLRVRY